MNSIWCDPTSQNKSDHYIATIVIFHVSVQETTVDWQTYSGLAVWEWGSRNALEANK